MDADGWGTGDITDDIVKWVEFCCFSCNDSGSTVIFIVCADGRDWQGGRNCFTVVRMDMCGWNHMASTLPEPDLYFSVFYDSLYVQKRSEKAYSLYSLFIFSVYNDMDPMKIGGVYPMIFHNYKKLTRVSSGAFFTVEAAILYPAVLTVIVLMVYLLLFQYDRCLLEQDAGRAAVQSAGKWTLTKAELDECIQKETMHFDEDKYIAWEGEDAQWKLEKNDVVVEKTGRLKYPFFGMGTTEKYWSAKASFRVDRSSPVFYLRRIMPVKNKTEASTD